MRSAEFHAAAAAAYAEKDLEAQVIAVCKELGLLRYHTYRSQRSPAGFPDDVIVGTRVLFRELKRQREKPSTAQQEWLDRLTAAGQDADVWRPSDWFSGRITTELRAVSTRR